MRPHGGLWQGLPALLLLLVAAHLAVLFGGRTLLPIAPSEGVLPDAPYGYQGPRADWTPTVDPAGSLNVAHAFDAFARRSLGEGILPFWNPYQGLGQPFLANGLSALFYPPNALHLLLPPAWWDLLHLLSWLLAAVFLHAYLRLVGLPAAAALVGGAVVLGSGFFQMYLTLRELPAVSAWWPLLLYGVEAALRGSGRRATFVLAAAVFATLTGGQPQASFLSLLVVSLYALARVIAQGPGRARALAALLPGAVAGWLLAAPAWLPFLRYALDAYSSHPPGAGVGELALRFATLATFVLPYLYGRVQTAPFGPVEGWSWDLSPGWLPAGGLFLAFAALPGVVRRPRAGPRCLAIVALVGIAKVWGVPGVHLLGQLPLLDRLTFPRYVGGFLALALAGLAAHGACELSKLEAREWRGRLVAWLALVVVLAALALLPIRSAAPGAVETPWATLLPFGGLGLAWAGLVPAGLFRVRERLPGRPDLFCGLAVLGVLLQGAAYAPHGHAASAHLAGSLAGLVLFAAVAAALPRLATARRRGLAPALGLAALVSLSLALDLLPSAGLPARYDALRRAPYLDVLERLQESGRYRSYPLDAMPQPNFAAVFGLSSLGNLEGLAPRGGAEFVRRYLDRGADPLWFAGNRSAGRDPQVPAVRELLEHARYFDLVAVRYVTSGLDRGLAAALGRGGLVPVHDDAASGVRIWERPGAAARVFLAPRVRLALSASEALAGLAELRDPLRTVWIESGPPLEASGPAGGPSGELLSFRLAPNEVEIVFEARSRGVLTLSDSFAEGWRARLDGREVPVLRVDGAFRGVRLESAGRHEVRFWYRPPGWSLSLGLAGLGALGLGAALTLGRR